MPATTRESHVVSSGNISYTDKFATSTLDPDWQFLREPKKAFYSLTDRPGSLVLHLCPETCDGVTSPAFLCRRQLHANSSATVRMEFSAQGANEKAGLLVFQNETHFYYLCVSVDQDGHRVAQLYKSTSTYQQMELLSSLVLKAGLKDNTVLLRATSGGSTYDFSCSLDGKQWKDVKENVDATFLSTKVAGGFVGCMYGLYATSMGTQVMNAATFDWFTYKGTYEPLTTKAKSTP
jgi:alpha-N-arabinofuranosidase